jgi:hypothetical protein
LVLFFSFVFIIISLVLGKLPVVRCARHVEKRWPSHSRETAPGNRSIRRAHRGIFSHRWKELLEFLLAPCGCPCHGSSATARLLDSRLFDGPFGKVNSLSSFFFTCVNLESIAHMCWKGFWTDGGLGRNLADPDSPNWLNQYSMYR